MPRPPVKRFSAPPPTWGQPPPAVRRSEAPLSQSSFDKLTPCCPESSAPMSSSIATTRKPTAPSSATFSIFPRWTPAAAGSYSPCLPRKLGIHPSDGERGQLHGGTQAPGLGSLPDVRQPAGANEIPAGQRRDLLARRKRKTGESRRRSNCPAAAKSVFISPHIRQPLVLGSKFQLTR